MPSRADEHYDAKAFSTSETNLRHAWMLVSTLVAHNLAGAVISPGSRSTPLVLALHHVAHAAAATHNLNGNAAAEHHDQTPLPIHVVLDERAAGFVALGLARATGRPALLLCTSGSAAAHYLPAVVEADEAGLGLIILTADRPPELHGVAAPQTTDQSTLFASHVRHSQQLATPSRDLDAQLGPRTWASAALAARTHGRHGPVHLNCPFREPLYRPGEDRPLAELVTDLAPHHIPRTYYETTAEPDAKASATLQRAHVSASKRGVIIVGPQLTPSNDEAAAAAALQLAAKLGWPLLADALSAVGRACAQAQSNEQTATLVPPVDALLRTHHGQADELARDTQTVLLLGRPPTSKRLNQWLARCRDTGEAATFIQLGDEPGRSRPDPQHLVTHHLAGETARVATQLLQEIPVHLDDKKSWLAATQSGARSWLGPWHDATREVEATLAAACDGDDAPLTEGTLARRLVAALPASAILHVASSMPVREINTFADTTRCAVTITANRGVNGIDGTIATALGLALAAKPGRPVAALLGDLAYWHDLDGLHTAAQLTTQHNRSLTLVIVDNAGGHIFDHLPIAQHQDPQAYNRYFLTPQQGDPLATAKALGATTAQQVEQLTTLEQALATTTKQPGLHLLHVPIDPQANQAWNETCFHQPLATSH